MLIDFILARMQCFYGTIARFFTEFSRIAHSLTQADDTRIGIDHLQGFTLACLLKNRFGDQQAAIIRPQIEGGEQLRWGDIVADTAFALFDRLHGLYYIAHATRIGQLLTTTGASLR